MGWAKEVSGSKFVVNLLPLLPFPLHVPSWDLWWNLLRARALGLGFRPEVGRQRIIRLPLWDLLNEHKLPILARRGGAHL